MPRPVSSDRSLELLQQRVMACTRCPRLVRHCRKVAQEKRRMYRDWEYWGKPVPSFGDPEAELLILGLAPAAHGANRTGRMFTGDRSGNFLYGALYEAEFASQPTSAHRDDGLRLKDCWITAAVRCAPPKNMPRPRELRDWRLRAVLALGRIAFDTYLRLLARRREFPRPSSFRFAHGVSYTLPEGLPCLFASYHPSRQNTQTGWLTPEMMRKVLTEIRQFLDL